MTCATCKTRIRRQPYARIFAGATTAVRIDGKVTPIRIMADLDVCSHGCLRCWLAANPDIREEEEYPE